MAFRKCNWKGDSMAKVICPECNKVGDVPNEFLGRRIKCPSCGEKFTAPTLPPSRATGKVKSRGEERPMIAKPDVGLTEEWLSEESQSVNTQLEEFWANELSAPTAPTPLPRQSSQTTKPCLFCGETILSVAVKCKHCGEFFNQPRTQTSQPIVQQQQQVVQTVVIQESKSKYKVPHLLHFLLTLLTFGVWLPIWIFHIILNSAERN